jgi:ribosomal protein S18 acetylase RimI-like enzyme
VTRDARRTGVGRAAFALLRQLWPPGARITVEVLSPNEAAQSFWRSVGFADYSLTLELRN